MAVGHQPVRGAGQDLLSACALQGREYLIESNHQDAGVS